MRYGVGIGIGILLSVAGVRAAEPAFDHELTRESPMSDHQFTIEDSGDEEARNSSPVQERVIERPAFIDTTEIGWSVGIQNEHTGDVG